MPPNSSRQRARAWVDVVPLLFYLWLISSYLKKVYLGPTQDLTPAQIRGKIKSRGWTPSRRGGILKNPGDGQKFSRLFRVNKDIDSYALVHFLHTSDHARARGRTLIGAA